jgi:D-serine dehydratase
MRSALAPGEQAYLPKGLPPGAGTGWSIFDSDVLFPLAVIRESAIAHNSRLMAAYCEQHGASLAPHGKTTMAPALMHRQLADGAWAITVATTWQAKTISEHGINRILIANEVVTAPEIRWLGQQLDTEPGFEPICYVDSVAGVALMDRALAEVASKRRLPVLLERGLIGGRTGVRSTAAGLAVAQAVLASDHLELVGCAGFEGIIEAGQGESVEAIVDEFLDEIVALTASLAAEGAFAQCPEVIVTAGGSAYFDRVVERFARLPLEQPVRVVLRSGCYLTHAEGHLDEVSPLGGHRRSPGVGERLIPAIEVWGAVLSRPEPTRVIAGLGRRDASHDGALPVAKVVKYRTDEAVRAINPIEVVTVNDQHAYLDVDPSDPLAVGDLIGFGIAHPCTTFDKWRAFVLVDDDYRVVDIVRTYF